MDSNSLLKVSMQVVQELLAKAQRSHRLPAMSCTWDNLHTALPLDAELAKTKLAYLFRQPEYPSSSMKPDSKESVLKLLFSAWQSFKSPISLIPITPLTQQAESLGFFPIFLSNMLSDRVELSAIVKQDGSKKWFAQAIPGRVGHITAISYGSNGVEFVHSAIDALESKGFKVLSGTQKELKEKFMRENSVPPPPEACNKLVESIACQVVMSLSMALDRNVIRSFAEQFPDEPYPNYHLLPKSTSNYLK